MPIIQNGQGLEIAVPPGQSIAIASLTGTYSATLLDGAGRGALASASAGGATYGPYPAGATLRVKAGVDSCVAYDVSASPIASAQYPVARYETAADGEVTGFVGPGGKTVQLSAGASPLSAAVLAYKDGLRTRPPIVLGLGDSNFGGNGAGLGGGTVPKWQSASSRGPIDQIKSVTPKISGLRLIDTAIFGESNCSEDGEPVSEYDPRLSLTGGWGVAGNPLTLGGRWFETANTTGEFKVSFGQRVNVVEVYFVTAGASADIKVMSSDGTVVGAFSCAGAAGVKRATFESSLFDDGVVRIKNNAAGNVFVQGVLAYPTDEPVMVVTKAAWAGGAVANLVDTSQAWTGVAFHKVIKPDLTITQLTINDILYETVAATYAANLVKLFDVLTENGAVLFATGAPGSDAKFYSTGRTIIQKARLTCAAYGIPFIDFHARFDNWASSNAKGWDFDANHRTYEGYRKQAEIFAKLVTSLVG